MKKLIMVLFLVLSIGILAEIVYITPTGKKYHPTKTCRGLRKAKKIIAIEKSEAIKRGYKPCKIGY